MSHDTDWNIDSYRTDYESEEHWLLRKKFMEVHKDKFPENELVCLAQVFTNIEFMGCKYPNETMELVANLSQDVAQEFRNERSKRLKRTFVKASDAAEARAKGVILKPDTKSTTELIENNNSKYIQSTSRQNQQHKNSLKIDDEKEIKKTKIDLFADLKFKKFVLFDCGDRNSIRMSGQRCGINVEEKESIYKGKKKIDTYVGDILVGTGISTNIKEAKATSFEIAFNTLQDNCYTIRSKIESDRIDIRKTDQTIECNLKKACDDAQKIDSNNIGFKMMKKLGWSGGGLGSKTQGIENPLDFLVKHNRKGLGDKSDIINADYFKEILTNYVKSDDIRDLYFESSFTKDERATLHQIASENNLKSSSYGKESNRYLVISKKTISPYRILEEILINKNDMYINKYEVTVPKQKANLFPDHINKKE